MFHGPEAAEAALVGLLPRVNPRVLRQRARIGKGLLALSTPAKVIVSCKDYEKSYEVHQCHFLFMWQ